MRASLERIYRRHRQGLYTLSLSITRCPSRAEDAVQEAFARLWKSGARPHGDPVAYVFAAVRNAAVEQVRRRRPDAAGPEPPASIYDGKSIDPAVAAANAERVEAVRDAVVQLPQAQREVLVMRIYGGLKFAQVAEATGRPLATVTTQYRRALQRLRRILDGDHEG